MSVKKWLGNRWFVNLLCSLTALWPAWELGKDLLRHYDWLSAWWLGLHSIAAVLFLIRRPILAYGKRPSDYLVVCFSVLYPYGMDMTAPATGFAGTLGRTFLLVGTPSCIFATLSLGRCFGVLPGVRGLAENFAYAFIRHPIYASYILMDIGILLSYPCPANFILTGLAWQAFRQRIKAEEEVLMESSSYLQYMQKVKFRMIPGLY